MKRPPIWFFCCIAAATLVPSSAWAAAFCLFQGAGLGLNFGTLDPSSNSAATNPVVATASLANMAGDCNPTNQTMQISITDGASSRQLTGPGGNVIAYSISGFPITLNRPGNNQWATWFTAGQITGTIAWAAYADAPAGTYTETVSITINP
jgi:spore coat protein U-like protein